MTMGSKLRFSNVTIKCRRCSKKFTTTTNKMVRGKKFCSRQCSILNAVSLVTKVEKVCVLCGEKYLISNNRQKACLKCGPDRMWQRRIARYGIGKIQFDKMVEEQGGTCALCPNLPTDIDHDHKTGIVRGILCGACNLQMAGIDKDGWLERVLKYIEKSKCHS